MALDDFDTHDISESQVGKPAPRPAPAQAAKPALVAKPVIAAPAPKSLDPEDEDLFDFPVVEMKLEAAAPVAAPAPARTPAPVAAPAAPAAKKPAPPAAQKPVAPPAPAPTPEVAPAKEPVAATAKAVAAEPRLQEKQDKQDQQDVAQAAQIVEDLEQLLGSDDEPHAPVRRLKGPSRLALAGVAALVLTNVLGLFFLWRTAQNYQSSVQAMNEKLAETLRRQGDAQSQAAAAEAQKKSADAPRPSALLESFEATTLQVAREEILAGEYADARKRLSRLLAVADRIEVESREDVEAQAAFLIASTYRKQAEAAREKSP
jgi:hypothetical protein